MLLCKMAETVFIFPTGHYTIIHTIIATYHKQPKDNWYINTTKRKHLTTKGTGLDGW